MNALETTAKGERPRAAGVGGDGGPTLLRGRGFNLGPYARRFALAERTLLHVLDLQAEQRPEHPWLVFENGSLSFSQARALTDRVGNAIATELPRGAHVGLFLRNQVAFLPALLGTMAAGAVSVPLNPELRGPLLASVIAHSDVQAIVVTADLLERLAGLESLGRVQLIVVCEAAGPLPEQIAGAAVVDWEQWLEGRSTAPAGARPNGWDLALIQFTSGTTGRSKGAMLPHQFVYLYSALVSDSLERRAEDVLSTPLPLCHAAALNIIAGSALHAGCTAHLKPVFSASRYWAQLAADGATFSILLGTMAEMILKATTTVPAHRVTDIMCLPFPPSGEEFERRFGTRLLWQGYGMTEVYPHPMPKRQLAGAPRDMVGHAVTWCDYGVVDEHDRLVGPGILGDLVYRPLIPHAMFAGYYKDPQATVDALRNLCFHTGDIAFYDDDGRVHYRGRKQDRIRHRGENVSATELEFVALTHDDVLEVAAYGVPGELGEHDVKLDVVVRGELDAASLHAWLTEQLPRYMIPRYLELRETLPKTPSERVEKYKLVAEGLDREAVIDFRSARK